MVEGGMKCVKYLLFIFNLIFVIAGIGLIAAGAYVKTKLDDYSDFFGDDYVGPGILLIIVGVIIFVLAFFGCCGAIKEIYCMTMTFSVFLAIIFILEISAGIAGFVLRDDIDREVQDKLRNSMSRYNESESTKGAWDKLQDEFECCGVNSSDNWPNHDIPESCCKDHMQKCNTGNHTEIFERGCAATFENWLKDQVGVIGGVGIGLAFVQIIGIILACCLARAIRKEYEVV